MATATLHPGLTTFTGGLRADQRGAVMVVGVFMAAFMVGSLWYIIGVGDAILYRERMQDGADAVAFAGAVYHARGMNIIAMINIIMGGILAILVAFKLVQLINTIALAISCVLCASVYGSAIGCPICTFTGNLVSPIEEAVSFAEELVDAALPVLSKTQVGVAIAMPWIAQAKSVHVAKTQYAEPVQGGGFISASLVPYVPKERLGLPVEEEEYSFLCEKAGTYVGELAFSPFGAFGSWISGVVGSIVGTFPGYFCNDSSGWGGGETSQSVSQSSLDGLSKQACEKKKEQEGNPPLFDMEGCVTETTNSMKEDLGKQESSSSSVDGDDKTPKKVFSGAKNGNGYFQLWSVVVGNEEWPKKAEDGVRIAAWNKSMSTPDIPWGKVAFSQAEFYYDDAGEWDDLKEDAMWNMYWRARLRRVRSPTPVIAGMLLDEVLGAIMGKMDPAVAGVLGGSEISGWLLGEATQGAFEKAVGSVHAGGGPWQGQFVKNANLANDAKIEVIH